MIEKQTKSGHWELCLKVVPLYFMNVVCILVKEKERKGVDLGGG